MQPRRPVNVCNTATCHWSEIKACRSCCSDHVLRAACSDAACSRHGAPHTDMPCIQSTAFARQSAVRASAALVRRRNSRSSREARACHVDPRGCTSIAVVCCCVAGRDAWHQLVGARPVGQRVSASCFCVRGSTSLGALPRRQQLLHLICQLLVDWPQLLLFTKEQCGARSGF